MSDSPVVAHLGVPHTTTPLVMGVVNVTPDSFSDGGRFQNPKDAIAHGIDLFAQGADILDIGGESTRPGSQPVDWQTELERVLPVVTELAKHGRVSIDTRKPEVAREAIAAGATMLNDISASLWSIASEGKVAYVGMHMQGEPLTMQNDPHYNDVVTEVCQFLDSMAKSAQAAGVNEIWIDPGFGFGKTFAHNLDLLVNIRKVVDLGWPVMVGTSRKAMLGRMIAASDGTEAPPPPNDRLAGSIATEVWAMHNGVGMIRAHDVKSAVHAAKVVAR